ncbi:MAG TPA: Uma2 family endonuclease [Thermoanaerobaculia bacterium]
MITGEELSRYPDLGPCELVDGRIVPLPPTRPEHGEIELDLGSELRAWARSSGRGRVFGGEVGLYIRRNPDTIRAADLIYVSHERYARWKTSTYFDIAPELVVEVLSPTDRRSDVMAKINDYFSIGVDRVWVVDSKLPCILAHRSMTEVRQFKVGDVLSDEELLPGFRLAVADLFKG